MKPENDTAEISAALDLRLADGTPADAFRRLAKAIDERRVSIHQAREVADILERRLRILDAEEFRRRLEAAEARALEIARRSSPSLPASKTVVDMSTSPESP